jgi:uncharacterized protein (TIGR02145 family)
MKTDAVWLAFLLMFIFAAFLSPPSAYCQWAVPGNELTRSIKTGAGPAEADRPKIAVYVTGDRKAGESAALGTKILAALVAHGEYLPVERTPAFLAEIEKEHIAQRSGAVDEKEIAALGKQFGVQYVCIADATSAFGSNLVSARIINVETAAIAAIGETQSDLANLSDLENAVAEIYAALCRQISKNPANCAAPPPNRRSQPLTDPRDGKKYRTATVGAQTWTAENISSKTGNSWCYDNKEENCQKYGRLYDWKTAQTACPKGWRLPTRRDWDTLAANAGGEKKAGKTLKSQNAWDGNDEYGWNALPCGARHNNGNFHSAKENGTWWSATEGKPGKAYGRFAVSGRDALMENESETGTGYGVRCVKE